VRIERFPEVDVASLPMHPTPPDFWQERAACFGVEPDVFFPISEEEAGPALAFCGVCPIREECLSWALKNGERYGVWGGTTEQQRRVNSFAEQGWASRLGARGIKSVRQLGPIQRERVVLTDNPHVRGRKDETREFIFDGMYVRALFPGRSHDAYLLQEVEITKPRWRVKYGLNVGASRDTMLDVALHRFEFLFGVNEIAGTRPNQHVDRNTHAFARERKLRVRGRQPTEFERAAQFDAIRAAFLRGEGGSEGVRCDFEYW